MALQIRDAVLLSGDDRRLVGYAVAAARKLRARNGLPPLADLDQLALTLAAWGQPDTADDPASDDELMTTQAAAELLGCSERTARRLAPRLGGRLIGGHWLLDAQAVHQHKAGSQ